MPLEQQIACILQSKHQEILKLPRDEQESRTYRLTVNMDVVCSADVTRYVLTRWRLSNTPVIRLTFTDCL